ncbi:MAG: pyridoxal phosphate-dependent aminotransferase [Pseudomonadota bacterium]
MNDPRLTPLAAALPATAPFVGPEAQERAQNQAFIARLGANESAFGPSSKAVLAMGAATPDIWKYGDPENHDLRVALAEHHGVGPEHIAVDAGIDTLMGVIVRLFVGAGEAVVTSDGTYPTLDYHVTGHGGVIHKVPYQNDKTNPAALVAKAIETGAKLIYLANPDNPMGSWHEATALTRAFADLPEHAILLLDEAYGEFAPDRTLPPVDTADRRILRLRTFSKAYGMAGARVGYAIGAAETLVHFDKVRNHFGMNRVAQVGALAALKDRAWLDHVVNSTARARERLSWIAGSNGLMPLASATNFVTVDCGAGPDFAAAVKDALIARGIFIRMPFAPPGNRCIRIGAGTPADLDHLARALPLALQDARAIIG